MKLYHQEKIVKAKKLLSRLRRNALRHTNGYVQYLTLTSLKGIASSEKLHLSSCDCLNDLGETLGENMYEASFTFGPSENLAMWCLYGVPNKEAVRVLYPCIAIKKWLDVTLDKRKLNVYSYIRQGYKPLNVKVKRIMFVDVAYGDLKFVKHCNDFFRVADDEGSALKILSGVIKDYAWRYEDEVRLIVELESVPYTSKGRKLSMIAIDFEEPAKSVKDGQAKLTFGPWAPGNCKRGKHIVAQRKLEFEESDLSGLVRCRCNDSEVAKRNRKKKTKCLKCGTVVEVNAKFCTECGSAIPQTREYSLCQAQ